MVFDTVNEALEHYVIILRLTGIALRVQRIDDGE